MRLLEITMVGPYRVYFLKNSDSRQRDFFSAYMEMPPSNPIILDDRNLLRLKTRLLQVVQALHPAGLS